LCSDENPLICVGVIVRRDNSPEKEELIKGKEVILSAGAIGSVQILLLSGIGPREELEKHGIPPIVHLEGVGQNLKDHLTVPLIYRTRIPTFSSRDVTLENIQRWTTEGKGILASSVAGSQAWFQVNETGTLSVNLFFITTLKSLYSSR
jgi:choline dehydrogenase-like flavoprotein